MTNTFSQNIRNYDFEMQVLHAEKEGYDSLYRVNYFENIIIRSELTSDVPRIELKNGTTGETIEIRPASEYQLGLSLDYKWIAIGFAFTPKFLLNKQDLQELNDSKAFAMSLNFFFSDRWRQELKYNYYQGFFSSTSTAGDDLDIQLKNTVLQSIEGSTYFIVNRNYSFRAHYAQTERQLKSAGSLIPRLIFNYSVTETNFTDVPEVEEIDLINSFDLIAQVGYLYTFVYNKKWFATVGVHPGIGYNYSQYKYGDNNLSKELFNNLTFAIESELNIGYNSYRWFFGTSYKLKNYNYSNSDIDEFKRNSGSFNIYLGYRFNDNKPMRKLFDWFEDKLGL